MTVEKRVQIEEAEKNTTHTNKHKIINSHFEPNIRGNFIVVKNQFEINTKKLQ